MNEIAPTKQVGERWVKDIATGKCYALIHDGETSMILGPGTCGRGIPASKTVLVGTKEELEAEIKRLNLVDASTVLPGVVNWKAEVVRLVDTMRVALTDLTPAAKAALEKDAATKAGVEMKGG